MFSPPPVIAAPEPTPMIVLLAVTFCIPEIAIDPETRITAGLDDCMAEISADELVTVTGGALPPPVVPPPCVAQPTRSNGAADAAGVASTDPAASSVATTAARTVFVDMVFLPSGTCAGRRKALSSFRRY